MLAALRDANERGAIVMSVCCGAFVLGEAGLLDGRRRTTHWRYADELARRFPKADVALNALYVEDGGVLTTPVPPPVSMPACTWSGGYTVPRWRPRWPAG